MDRTPSSRASDPGSPTGGRIGDRLGQIAQGGARRTRASWIVYGVLGLAALVIALGQVFGWWQSPVERKIREEVERRNAARPPAAEPPVPARAGEFPVPPR